MENVFIYCRVSTVGQAEEGWSLDAQEKSCKKFADDKGYKIIKVFRDEGRSGTNTDKRPALQEMILECQKSKNISAVIVYDTSRFARNTQDHLAVKAILRKVGTKLISLSQPMLDDSATGKMVDVILASVNQFQSDMNSQKTLDGMQERFNSGWFPGLAKLGYLNEEVNGQKVIVNDPIKWSLIQEALKMYLRGSYSAQEVCDTLYAKGLTSRNGKKIAHSIMTTILRNSFYAGIMSWGGQEIMGNHEPMITVSEHRRIVHIMADHNQHASRRRIYDFLLRGFVFCDICGKRYVGEKRKKKNIDYYHCSAPARIHSNDGQNIEAGELERMIAEKFKGIQFSQQFINLVVEKVKNFYAAKIGDVNKKKLSLLNRKMGIEKQIEVAETKLMAGTLKDEAFIRINNRFEADIKSIQKQIDEIEKKRRVDVDTVRTVLLLTNNIFNAYEKASPRVKRLYLSLFWKGFWVKDRKIIKSEPTDLISELIKNPTFGEASNVRLLSSASYRLIKPAISSASEPLLSVFGSQKETDRIRTDWLR
jgi:DNA invertase Pin-like site-specific DNA recombinase